MAGRICDRFGCASPERLHAPKLSSDQWRLFARTAWGRRPFCWPGLGPLASSDEIFRAIGAVRSSIDAGLPGIRLRFYLGHTAQDARCNWPRGTDRSCREYRTRIRKRLRGREYLLAASGLQVSFELWARLADFLRGLFSITGIPPYIVEADGFLGNYGSTAFGIHQDDVGVLMSVVEGRKRIHFWRAEDLSLEEATRHRHAYGSLLRRATTIEAEVGDLLYWPARFWHVAESAGDSLTLHVGLGTHGGTATNRDVDGTPVDRITSAVRDVVAKHLGARDEPIPLPLKPPRGAAARDLATVIRAFSDMRSPYGGLAPVLVGRFLNRITGVGFEPAPLPRPACGLSGAETLRLDGGRPILWHRVGGTLVVSANGHAFTAPFDMRLLGILRRINGGGAVRLNGGSARLPAHRAHRGGSRADLAAEVLRRLYRLRALKRAAE